MLKKCTICKKRKRTTAFNKNKRRADGLQNVCRTCAAKRSKSYYKANTKFHRLATKERRKAKRRENKEFLDAIKAARGCLLCPERELCCLEFHHVDPAKKDFGLGMAAHAYELPLEVLLEEVKKCAVLCSNCHRKIHAGLLTLPSVTQLAE